MKSERNKQRYITCLILILSFMYLQSVFAAPKPGGVLIEYVGRTTTLGYV